jgi:hypothetical protein
MRVEQIRPFQVSPTKVRPLQVGILEEHALQVGAAQIRATQVGSSEVALAEIHVPQLERGRRIRRGREPAEHSQCGLHVWRAKPQVGKLLKWDERIGRRVAVRISRVGLLCMALLLGAAAQLLTRSGGWPTVGVRW